MTMLYTFSHTLLNLCQLNEQLLQYSFDAGKGWAACNVHASLPTTAAADAAAAAAAASVILVTVCLASDIGLTIASACTQARCTFANA